MLDVRHNLALIRFFQGDVPAALSALTELASAYADLGDPHLELTLDRARILLVAGLAVEAVDVIESAPAWAQQPPPGPGRAAGDAGRGATGRRSGRAGAGGRPGRSAPVPAPGAGMVAHPRRPGRPAGADRARPRVAPGRGGPRRLPGRRPDRGGVLAHLLAGRELARNDPAAASAYLSRAAVGRHRGSPLSRTTAWLARALELEVDGRPRVLDAVGRGLDALAEHRASLGSPELRALTALHGSDLADPGRPARAPAGPAGARAVERPGSCGLPERAGAGTPGPDHRRAARDHPWPVPPHHRRGGPGRAAGARARAGPARAGRPAGVGGDAGGGWSGPLHVGRLRWSSTSATGSWCSWSTWTARCTRWSSATVGGGRSASDPPRQRAKALDAALYGLRTATRGRPVDLARLGVRLESALLGDVVRLLPAGRAVVVSPPAALLAAPWALLPSLHSRPVALTPSATAWVRAHAARPRSTRAVLVVGPDLPTGGAEVAPIARMHAGASLIASDDATVAAALAALDGAALGHIAAHGSFRPETPMFSSLHLADGAMTVDDVHRLGHPPHRIVLPACRSGVAGRRGRPRRHRLRRRAAGPGDRRGRRVDSSTSTTPPPSG